MLLKDIKAGSSRQFQQLLCPLWSRKKYSCIRLHCVVYLLVLGSQAYRRSRGCKTQETLVPGLGHQNRPITQPQKMVKESSSCRKMKFTSSPRSSGALCPSLVPNLVFFSLQFFSSPSAKRWGAVMPKTLTDRAQSVFQVKLDPK